MEPTEQQQQQAARRARQQAKALPLLLLGPDGEPVPRQVVRAVDAMVKTIVSNQNRLDRCGRGGGKRQGELRPAAVGSLQLECVGQLGGLGEQIFQFAFGVVLAERHRLPLSCPAWGGAHVFAGAAGAACRPAAAGAAGPPPTVLADRIVTADAEWREWAATREPMASILRAEGPESGTARRVKKEIPQVGPRVALAELHWGSSGMQMRVHRGVVLASPYGYAYDQLRQPQVGKRAIAVPHDGGPLMVPAAAASQPVAAALWGYFQLGSSKPLAVPLAFSLAASFRRRLAHQTGEGAS